MEMRIAAAAVGGGEKNLYIYMYIYFGHLLTWCKNIWLQVYRYKKMQLKQQEQDMLNCP